MKFYTYSQNNSGGSFTDPARFVIIEANSKYEAEDLAESLGVYFDGCDSDQDCSCCGDRWSRYCDESEEPRIYDRAPDEYAASKDNMFRGETATFLIRSYDGTIRKGE